MENPYFVCALCQCYAKQLQNMKSKPTAPSLPNKNLIFFKSMMQFLVISRPSRCSSLFFRFVFEGALKTTSLFFRGGERALFCFSLSLRFSRVLLFFSAKIKKKKRGPKKKKKHCGQLNQCENKHQVEWEVQQELGEYWYMDIRNNNFANRKCKGSILVVDSNATHG